MNQAKLLEQILSDDNLKLAMKKVKANRGEPGVDGIRTGDLEKFFDTVLHDKLMTLVAKQVGDGDVVSLIRKYLVSGIMIDDEYKESVIGTPQGGNLSPLLSNIMLNELDWELEARGLNFVRYADDCIILVGSEKAADRVMQSVVKFIETKLGMRVNVTKSKVDRPDKIKYLGYGFYYDSRQRMYKAKPHQKSVERIKQKIKELPQEAGESAWSTESCGLTRPSGGG